MKNTETSNRRQVLAWCLYDWANSAFALTVMTAFFPVFFKSFWNTGLDATVSTARLGIGASIAGLIVAALSPVVGALADAGHARKRFLFVFALLGMAMTASLYLPPRGSWLAALVIFMLADVGFSCANLFYDSLLVDVAAGNEMDRVSSLGFSLGYLGCGLLFVGNVAMTMWPGFFGLADKAGAVRLSFVTAAVWWLVFSIPLLLFVKERGESVRMRTGTVVADGLKRLLHTVRAIARRRSLWLFLVAYWLYIDGVFTFIRMAVDFGMAIGLSQISLMLALIVVQFVAFPAAIAFGRLAEKIGTERTILSGIVIYILVCCVGAPLLQNATQYIVLAAITGMAQGGIQALSRSYFGKIIPAGESGEFFGFYNLIGKSSVILGPATVGVVALITRAAGAPSMLASRIGMASVAVFFIAGALLLRLADRARVREQGGAA